ncbi:MAG: EFR1 family ferrodoxin [Spirochaetaceae bacterium]|nr:EFR1 family ferrodoxin [Spirochaetaceae bacterium]
MIDNYLPVFKIEDQLAKEPAKKIEEKLANIVQAVTARAEQKVNKGLGSKVMTNIIKRLEVLRDGDVDQKFTVAAGCTQCGICAQVCPVGNIVMQDGPTYQHNCSFCMGCVNLCAANAIQLKGQRSTARFKNPNVTVKAIIAANNQGK